MADADTDTQKSNAALLKNMKSKSHYPSAGLALDFGNDKHDERTRLSLLTVSKRAKYRPIYRFIPTHMHQKVGMPFFTSFSWISYDTNTDIKLFEKCIANTVHPVLAVCLEVLLCKRAIGEQKTFRNIITD